MCMCRYVLSTTASSAATRCAPCPAGTYSVQSVLCQPVDASHYVPLSGQPISGRVPCPNGTVYSVIQADEFLGVTVQLREGASSAEQCSCPAGTFLPYQAYARPNASAASTRDDGRVALRLHSTSEERSSALRRTGCQPCPKGATCFGNWLLPIAQEGYGVRLDQSAEAFYPCKAPGACQAGAYLSVTEWAPVACAFGYQEAAPLCSLCSHVDDHAKTRGECVACDWHHGVYILLTSATVLAWFPITAYLCESMESLEITFAFLQFLGLYSGFEVRWPSPFKEITSGLAFFTLDMELMHIACVFPKDTDGSHYFILWCLHSFLPLVYMLLCLLHLLANYAMYRLAMGGFLRRLLNRGWRPRRQYTISSIRDTYLPRAILYTHLYYLTGVTKALEPLFCESELDAVGAPTGRSFLFKEPAIVCFGTLHTWMLALDVFSIAFYVVCCPLAYLYIFFRLVPQMGLEHPRLVHNYYFMWSRFEGRVYWWEAIELVRSA